MREFGYSTLLTLRLDKTSSTGLRTTANNPSAVESYPDIIDIAIGIASDFDPDNMVESIKRAKNYGTITAVATMRPLPPS